MPSNGFDRTALVVVAAVLLFAGGCAKPNPGLDSPAYVFGQFTLPPRARPGSYHSSTIGTNFADPERLGRHGYYFSLTEQNGIVYTCRAGPTPTLRTENA